MKPSHLVLLGTVFVLLMAVLMLGGCQSVRELKLPVTRPCVTKDVPSPPDHYADDGIKAEKDPAERIRMRAAANQQRKARLEVVEPIIELCRTN